MRQKPGTEYQAKVIDDKGLIRGRVPCAILKAVGARPGDYMIFSLAGAGKAVMRLVQTKKRSGKSSSSSSRKTSGKKRR